MIRKEYYRYQIDDGCLLRSYAIIAGQSGVGGIRTIYFKEGVQ